MTAKEIITLLNLEPLQGEGGYFRQTFKDTRMVREGDRTWSASTCIYYLLTRESPSLFHRVRGTEIFHYLRGDSAEMYLLERGGLTVRRLGAAIEHGEEPQGIVRPLVWQALRLAPGQTLGWSLFSTTVSPGFEYEDFELGVREPLLQEFPEHAKIIGELTHGSG
jgi:predicted cupin superfamily sugar epimerase